MKQSLHNLFIRPPRQAYFTYDLGPSLIISNGNRSLRKDSHLTNLQGNKLTVSFYEIERAFMQTCVVYLHTHHGSKLQGVPLVQPLIGIGVNVCLFDFAGYGNSQGDNVSLGCQQIKDIKLVIQYLSDCYNQSNIILWGRSMGAVCSLLYLSEQVCDLNIMGAIFDSPFYSLEKLSLELCEKVSGIPEILLKPISYIIRQQLQGKIDFNKLQLLTKVKSIKVPGLFLASKEDQFIKSQHSQLLYKHYGGQKQLSYLKTDHNQARRSQDIQIAFNFISDIADDCPKRCLRVLSSQLQNIINRKNHQSIITSYLYQVDSNYSLEQTI